MRQALRRDSLTRAGNWWNIATIFRPTACTEFRTNGRNHISSNLASALCFFGPSNPKLFLNSGNRELPLAVSIRFGCDWRTRVCGLRMPRATDGSFDGNLSTRTRRRNSNYENKTSTNFCSSAWHGAGFFRPERPVTSPPQAHPATKDDAHTVGRRWCRPLAMDPADQPADLSRFRCSQPESCLPTVRFSCRTPEFKIGGA